MTIQVKNSLFNCNSTSNIVPISDILNIQWIDPRTAFLLGSLMSFDLSFTSLGEPSCLLISYTTWSGSNTVLAFLGTSLSYCTSLYPSYTAATVSQLYLGQYSAFTTSATTLTLSTSAINVIGNHYLNATVCNSVSKAISINNFTVVNTLGLCDLPYVDIVNKSSLFYEAKIYQRSDMITLTSITDLNCSSSLGNQKQWILSKVNPQDGSDLFKISLASNPTATYAQLVIQPFTLAYGLYKVVYQVIWLF